jgi:hypothetical protein
VLEQHVRQAEFAEVDAARPVQDVQPQDGEEARTRRGARTVERS